MAELANPETSRAVLVGAAQLTFLPPIPAVRNNITDLAATIQSPDLWGIPAKNCLCLLDVDAPSDVARAYQRVASTAGPDGMLLLYYAGHGMIHPHNDSLLLALPKSDPTNPEWDGLPYQWLKEITRRSPARRRVVILDCCYAGRASTGSAIGSPTGEMADKARIDEACLLVSAGPHQNATAPQDQQHTAFTGEMLGVMRRGLDGAGPVLSVKAIFEAVRPAMVSRDYEEPVLMELNSGGGIALVRNAATKISDLTGYLLVAARRVTDSDLHESTVLVLRHDSSGAVGVRLNRPTLSLPAEFGDDWRRLLREPATLFDGGPRAQDGFIAVAHLRRDATPPLRFTPIRDRLGTVSLAVDPGRLRDALTGLRVFRGYLGWGPGELERYVEGGELARTREPASTVFTARPREQWSTLLGELGRGRRE